MILISFCTQGKGGSEALRPESGGTSSSDPEAHILDATSCHTEFSFQSKGKDGSHTLISPKGTGKAKGESGAVHMPTHTKQRCHSPSPSRALHREEPGDANDSSLVSCTPAHLPYHYEVSFADSGGFNADVHEVFCALKKSERQTLIL